MFTLQDLLYGGALPAVVGAVALAVMWYGTRHAGAAWIAGVVLGYLAGQGALDAERVGIVGALAKSWRPHEARDWLPLALLLAVVPAGFAVLGKHGKEVAWLLSGALCLVLPWRLLAGSAYLPEAPAANFDVGPVGWTMGEAVLWILGIAATLFASWRVLEAGPGTLGGWRSFLAVLAALGATIVVGMSGSFTYAQLLGVLTATLAGCSGTATILRLQHGPEAAAGPIVVVFGGTLVMAHFYSDLTLLNTILLLLAMTAAAGWLPRLKEKAPGVQAAVRCAVCLIPLAVAVALAVVDFLAMQGETEANPYLSL